MPLPNIKTLTFCCLLGYTLWVATYAVCTMIAVGIGPLEVLTMGVLNFMFCLVVFCGGAVLVVSCLLLLYYLLSIIFPKDRLWGDASFVILSGLAATVLVSLRGSHADPFEVILISWGFFSLPALYTVFCLRGWEWCRRRKGQG